MSRFGATKRAAATYIVLAGAQRGVSLLILPFITHVMSPTDYGAASTLTASALLLTATIATPLTQLIIRAAARDDEDGPALLRVAGTYCYVIVPVAMALVAALFAVFGPQFLGVSAEIWAIEILAIGFQPAATVFALWVAQGRQELRRFIWLSTTSIFVLAVTKMVFVVWLKLGVLGWVVSDLASAVLAAIVAMLLVRLPRATVSRQHVRHALSFALPLIPHSVSFWALVFLSRPAMASVSTLEQVGLFSFGLNLAQLAGLVLTEMNRGVLVRYSRESFPAPTHETFGPVRWQLVAAFAVPAVVGCGVAVTGRWILAEPYWQSFPLTGVLLVGQAAFGLYLIPMNYLTQTAGLPRYSVFASGAGAALVFFFTFAFGHRGAIAVAYVTVAGFLLMAVAALVLARANKLNVSWKSWLRNSPEICLAALSLACSVAALQLAAASTASWILAGISLTLVLGAALITIWEPKISSTR